MCVHRGNIIFDQCSDNCIFIPPFSFSWSGCRSAPASQVLLEARVTEIVNVATPFHRQWVWWHSSTHSSPGLIHSYMSDPLIFQSQQFHWFPLVSLLFLSFFFLNSYALALLELTGFCLFRIFLDF